MSIRELRRRARWIVASRLALGGGVVGGLLLGIIGGPLVLERSDPMLATLAGVVSTTLLGFGALRAPRDAAADRPLRDFLRAIAAGLLNVPAWFACLGTAPRVHGGGQAYLGLVEAFAVIGAILSVPLGAIFGLVHAAALSRLRAACVLPTSETLQEARRIGMAVTVLAQIGVAVLAFADPVADRTCMAACSLGGMLLVDVVLSWREARVRRRFIAAASEPGPMRIVPRAEAKVNPALAPLEPDATHAVIQARAAAYRELPWAIALVRQHEREQNG